MHDVRDPLREIGIIQVVDVIELACTAEGEWSFCIIVDDVKDENIVHMVRS